MAQLSSPGVDVSVIDESFYTPSAPGTVPLIVVATAANKANSAGTGIAPGTLAANAGKVYLLTSQMDLGTTFGVPYFQTDANNNPVHGGEINEYGLQAAYSFLGVSNRAYVVRADVDLSQLKATATAPHGAPADGTLWLDTDSTLFGIFEWNSASASVTGGQTFTNVTPIVITDTTKVVNFAAQDYTPKASVGAVGDYALVAVTNLYKLWFKNYLGTWVQVGTTNWVNTTPTILGNTTGSYSTSGHTITINSVQVVNSGTTQDTMKNAINTANITGITAATINGYLAIFSTGVDVVIGSSGTGLTESGITSGTYKVPALSIAPHTQPPQYKVTAENRPSGSVWVKTTTPNAGANYLVEKYDAAIGKWVKQAAPVYASGAAALAALDSAGGGVNLPAEATYVKFNDSEANPVVADFKVYARSTKGVLTITSKPIGTGTITPGAVSFTMAETTVGSATFSAAKTISFTAAGTIADADTLAGLINSAGFTNVVASTFNTTTTTRQVVITHVAGGDIKFDDATATLAGGVFATSANLYADPSSNGGDGKFIGSLWTSVSGSSAIITASGTAPTAKPNDGTLWYDNVVTDVDLMVHNGHTWVGYQFNANNVAGKYSSPFLNITDPNGPIISATQPKKQSDNTDLAAGDIWIDTSDLENFPIIRRYNGSTWALIDNTDQTTENGIVFADARWDTTGTSSTAASITDLLASDYLDFDAPDPALYPQGTLLWNLRRSGNNVKRYAVGYVDTTARNIRYGNASQTSYFADRWVSEAPNTDLGAGQFGRKAQRAVVLKGLNALINENEQIRDEDSRIFNLISCPGYLETLPALDALNTDRGLLSFVIADSPARLAPDATTLSNWGNNTANATGDGEEGLISTNPYSAVYYPWGMTTDLLGNDIVVPPSHIMLRTIALSDNVSYPWFAPAGTRRGGVSNASSVGYVNPTTGEYNTIALNTGQRDTLADIHVNPITYIGGVGLVAYGQKTRQLVASSMDRINVARLVIYLRYKINQIAKPFIFEPNDTITRNEIKQQIESLLLELTGQRALYDYLVVCDASNNTPSRIDRNELHVDIAIEPVKAVEFIYIPLRLENTGAIKGLGK